MLTTPDYATPTPDAPSHANPDPIGWRDSR